MIKFIHFADTHIGVDTTGPIDPATRISGRVMDYFDSLDAIIDFAVDENVDIALFAGDAFHTNNPNPIYQSMYTERILRLRHQCPVVLLVGNHDVFRYGSFLGVYDILSLDNIIVGSRYEVLDIQTKNGPLQVATAPWPAKHVLDEPAGDVILKLESMLDPSIPSVLLGHFSLEGARYGVERDYVMGSDASVTLDEIGANWDYVALGHIHMHQSIFDNPPIVYSGSIERVTFGEEQDQKGFIAGKLSLHSAKWEFIQLDARPYKTIEVKIGTKYPMDEVLDAIHATRILDGSVVRIIIHIKDSYIKSIDKNTILKTLEGTGMYYLSSFAILPIRANIQRMNPSEFNITKTPTELLERVLNLEHKPNTVKSLMRMAKDIMKEVDNDQSI